MKISVLIAACRADRFIASALASVAAQTHREWEVIVVEDGSHDGTEKIVHDFATEVSQSVCYTRFLSNRGVAATRNRLLALATGDVVAFLDADDTWTPDHLANAAGQFSIGADLVVSDVTPFDLATGRVLGEIKPPPQLLTHPVRTLFTRSVIVTSSSVALGKAFAMRVGDFDAKFRVGEDRDFWLRCAFAGARISLTRQATCRYAKHAGSTMAGTLLVATQVVEFYEKHRDFPAVPAALRRRQLVSSLVTQGRLLRSTDPLRAARCFWRAWSLQPVQIQALGQLALTGWRSAGAARKSPGAA